MPNSKGYRAGTRKKFRRAFRTNGPIHLSSILRTYKMGQYVDIVGVGSIHKGMPHKQYHGRTGRIWNVTPRAVGVEVNKQVRGYILKKRIHVRVQHIRPSRCNEDFLARRKARLEGKRM
jgi:large subunit ribosomal protein L21e